MALVEGEPAWMSAVRERDAFFGAPPTRYEDTQTWASVAMGCAANRTQGEHAIYSVPAFLSSEIHYYAFLDGWTPVAVGKGMICPACARERAEEETRRGRDAI